MKMETTAKLNNLRMSPRKIRLLVDLVRGMNVQEAMAHLHHSRKVAALPLRKLLASAIANARHNHDMEEETLVIKSAYVNGGPIMYRWMPRAMGRATPIRKRTSHITLVLEGEVQDKKAKKQENKKAVEEKAEESTEVKSEKKVIRKKTTKKSE